MRTQKEIEKGCGKDYKDKIKQFGEFIGVILECDEKGLCPTCQALLQQSGEFIELINHAKEVGYPHSHTITGSCYKQELKSSIIGNKEKNEDEK